MQVNLQGGDIIKINKQPYLMLQFFFGAITICLSLLYLLNYVNGVIVGIFLGAAQLFSGFHQISMAQEKDSKGINKGNKKIGLLFVFAGVFLIINVIIKVMI